MGTFHTDVVIENMADRHRSIRVPNVLVDTGSEYTWILGRTLESIGVAREKKDITLVMANGQQVTRSIGFAIVRVGTFFTVDEVVFAEEGDLFLLGARTLEGFNVRVDPQQRKLVAAGPLPAATANKQPATSN